MRRIEIGGSAMSPEARVTAEAIVAAAVASGADVSAATYHGGNRLVLLSPGWRVWGIYVLRPIAGRLAGVISPRRTGNAVLDVIPWDLIEADSVLLRDLSRISRRHDDGEGISVGFTGRDEEEARTMAGYVEGIRRIAREGKEARRAKVVRRSVPLPRAKASR